MLNNRLMKVLFSSLVFLLLIPARSQAEFSCRGNVSYKWQREKEETQIPVFIATLEATGIDEAAAKVALSANAERDKAKAMDQCKREHENQAGCIATKLNSAAPIMQTLNFSSRKLLEESIGSDCKAQQGKCVESALSDPVCHEVVSQSAADVKEAGKEAAAKDEKGKKKK